MRDVGSQETYIGYDRAVNFISPGGAARDSRHVYATATPSLDHWGLSGEWTVGGEHAALDQPDGSIVYRFHARDLHLVLGTSPAAGRIRCRVSIDGALPGDRAGDARGLA